MRGVLLYRYKNLQGHIAPLVVFRIYFGLMMFAGIVRFWLNGWIEKLYIEPGFHFHYTGFEFVQVPGQWTYTLFAICGLSALGIMAGYRYRLSSLVFFLSFTYIELMDKTTYLNHYYFISLVSFLLLFLPAGNYFSADVRQGRAEVLEYTYRWHIDSIRLMLGIVYFYAGLAKLNSDWLFHAQPLSIWLPTQTEIPFLGSLFQQKWMHFAMSWGGALYDLAIPFLLLNRRTRHIAFILVLFFHGLTSYLFPIGMFPYIMIGSTLVFFSDVFHKHIIRMLSGLLRFPAHLLQSGKAAYKFYEERVSLKFYFLLLFFVVQLALPFRNLLYPGELFWTEEGYRFSWRVMLMEKAGWASFSLYYPDSGERIEIDNCQYLTAFQEKQMATQPDFMVEYARYLSSTHSIPGETPPRVYAKSYVALNGRGSKVYIDPNTDLAAQKNGLHPKTWLLPFEDAIKGL